MKEIQAPTPVQSKRIDYFDLLRTVAIFFVILIHCTAPYFTSLPTDSKSWLISNLFESISRWGVPIFIMISGALHLSRDRDIKTFFKKNVLKLAIILLAWNLIYAVVGLIKGDSLSSSISSFVGGHYHLWFLYMLLGLYLLTPFLKTFIKDPRHAKLFLLISFIFGIVLPWSANILAAAPAPFKMAGSSLTKVTNLFGFGNLIGYCFYYVLGYYLHHEVLKARTRKIIYIAGCAGFLITFCATWGIAIINNSASVIFLKDLTVNNVLVSAALFTFAKHHTKKNPVSNLLIRMSKYSLGIYVMHALILENVLIFLPSMPIFINVPIWAVACFLICLVATFCLQKIPFLRKIV